MREVLISIQPKWCELIALGKKTVEVRKTKPKLETPFKCYIYCTVGKSEKDILSFACFDNCKYMGRFVANGKVIGEFVCDRIYDLRYTPKEYYGKPAGTFEEFICENSCLSFDDIKAYANGNDLYGWHITDLVVYDEPRELRDFKPYNRTEEDCKFSHLGLAIPNCKDCRECYVKRPFQSWGYVEATEPRQTAD